MLIGTHARTLVAVFLGLLVGCSDGSTGNGAGASGGSNGAAGSVGSSGGSGAAGTGGSAGAGGAVAAGGSAGDGGAGGGEARVYTGTVGRADGPYDGLADDELIRAMLADIVPQQSASLCDPLESHCARIFVMNASEQVVGEEYRAFDGTVTSTETVTYDDTTGAKLQSSFWLPVDSTPRETTTYTYDDAGRLETETRVNVSGTHSDTVYTYDGTSGTIVTQSYATDGSLSQTISLTVTYDAQGRLIASTGGASDVEYVYSGAHLVDVSLIGVDGTYHEHAVFNGEGNVIREEVDYTDADGLVDSVTEYVYETHDLDGDGVIDGVVSYAVYPPPDVNEQVGANDDTYQGSGYDTSGGLSWGTDWGDSNCSTCGNMLGEINKILMGF